MFMTSTNILYLYDKWHDKSKFMSTGNTDIQEWHDLLNYCKENKEETARFYLDLISLYESENDNGFRSDNLIGFLPSIIYETFKDQGIPKFVGFISLGAIQEVYKIWLNECYFGNKDNLSFENKLQALGISHKPNKKLLEVMFDQFKFANERN